MARQINLSNKSMWVETTLLGELMRDYLQCKCSSRRNITRSRKETNNGYFHLSLRKSQKNVHVLYFNENTFYIAHKNASLKQTNAIRLHKKS